MGEALASPKPITMFDLLRLPQELRDKIYEYALVCKGNPISEMPVSLKLPGKPPGVIFGDTGLQHTNTWFVSRSILDPGEQLSPSTWEYYINDDDHHTMLPIEMILDKSYCADFTTDERHQWRGDIDYCHNTCLPNLNLLLTNYQV